MTKDRPWWRTPRRVFQPILRVNDGALDPRDMARQFRGFGCNTILANAGGIAAWYPTKVPYHTQVPGMRGDFLGELLEESHRLDMRVIIRFEIQLEPPFDPDVRPPGQVGDGYPFGTLLHS